MKNIIIKLFAQIKRELIESRWSVIYLPAFLSTIFMIGVAIFSYYWLFIRKEPFPVDTDLNMVSLNAMYTNCSLIMSVYLLVVINYLSGALYEDRRNKQILFWRSMPVSETLNLSGKVLLVIAVVPILLLCINLITALFFSGLGVILLKGINAESLISFPAAMEGNTFIVPFQIFIDNLFGVIFLLPCVGYFLLVSAWAKRFPLMIALGAPAFLMLIDFVLGRFGLTIGINYLVMQYSDFFREISSTMMLREVFEFETKLIMPMIISLIVGLLLMAVSIWLRNNRYEI